MGSDDSPPAAGFLSRCSARAAMTVAALAAFYVICLLLSEVDVRRLWEGLPRLGRWAVRAWPPDFSDFSTLLRRAAETVAMATVGTTISAAIAAPLCLLGARNTSPHGYIHVPVRWLLNVLRGIDSFVFALLFVAAVGLGPFAGVLGIAVHSTGSLAKLWSESIETAEPGPAEAALATGARELKVFFFALLPDVMPSLSSAALYVWEFNVRASTVLGIVGAGGIGQELKSSIDLLAFPRVFAILLIIFSMVTVIDHVSAFARARLT
jgi:phosphonate transport system permease protein